VPEARLIFVFTVFEWKVEYFFTPSTQTSILAIVPVTVPLAQASTGEFTVEC